MPELVSIAPSDVLASMAEHTPQNSWAVDWVRYAACETDCFHLTVRSSASTRTDGHDSKIYADWRTCTGWIPKHYATYDEKSDPDRFRCHLNGFLSIRLYVEYYAECEIVN